MGLTPAICHRSPLVAAQCMISQFSLGSVSEYLPTESIFIKTVYKCNPFPIEKRWQPFLDLFKLARIISWYCTMGVR